jgi:hypothetical protein
MRTVLLILVAAALSMKATGCGIAPAVGSGAYAEEIPGPGGVRCFAIYQDGRAVGGNCQ